jgi:RNA polymerase sigma-70 factor (ECF subfamily)
MSFDELVIEYQDSIYNYVCKMVGHSSDAEDLAQDVFVKAYQSLGNFRGDCSYRTWLFRIATNLCVDTYRRRGRRDRNTFSLDQPLDGDEGEMRLEIPDWDSDPLRVLSRKDLQAVVQAAIDSLPDKLRSVVLLYDIEGLAYEEIAEILNCPLGTVKSRLFNARLRLKDKLKPYLDA